MSVLNRNPPTGQKTMNERTRLKPAGETARTLILAVGQVVNLPVGRGDMTVQVTILDSRTRWGTVDYLVSPVTGDGDAWVEKDSVRAI
jgi:hypothetical protein